MTVDAFRTLTGLVVPAISTEQMREVDRVAVQDVGPNLYQMMENAGRNLASLCVEQLGERWALAPVVVLAGTGGNGRWRPSSWWTQCWATASAAHPMALPPSRSGGC